MLPFSFHFPALSTFTPFNLDLPFPSNFPAWDQWSITIYLFPPFVFFISFIIFYFICLLSFLRFLYTSCCIYFLSCPSVILFCFFSTFPLTPLLIVSASFLDSLLSVLRGNSTSRWRCGHTLTLDISLVFMWGVWGFVRALKEGWEDQLSAVLKPLSSLRVLIVVSF